MCITPVLFYLSIHYMKYIFFCPKHPNFSRDPVACSGWNNPPCPPLMFHILWVAAVETWLLPLEVSHGGPLWPVPVCRGWGRMRRGRGILDWNVAFRMVGDCGEWQWPLPLCLALLPLGPWAVNDAAPGKVPLTLCSPERTEKQSKRGAKGGWRKAERSIDSALNGDAALQGRPLVLLWFFQSILGPIFLLLAAMLLLSKPFYRLWQGTHIPIIPCCGKWEQRLMWSWANMCVPISADKTGFCAAERHPDRQSLLESQQPWLMTAEVSERSVQSGALPVSQLSQRRENRGEKSMSDDFTFGYSHRLFACSIINKFVTNLHQGESNWKLKATFSVCLHLLNISVLNWKCDFLWEQHISSVTKT